MGVERSTLMRKHILITAMLTALLAPGTAAGHAPGESLAQSAESADLYATQGPTIGIFAAGNRHWAEWLLQSPPSERDLAAWRDLYTRAAQSKPGEASLAKIADWTYVTANLGQTTSPKGICKLLGWMAFNAHPDHTAITEALRHSSSIGNSARKIAESGIERWYSGSAIGCTNFKGLSIHRLVIDHDTGEIKSVMPPTAIWPPQMGTGDTPISALWFSPAPTH